MCIIMASIKNNIFIILAFLIGLISFGQTYWQSSHLSKSALQLHHLGAQFQTFMPLLQKTRIAGYYTDKNMEHPLALAQFQQAQYTLAPTVLDLNQTHYALVIFDGTTPEASLAAMQKLGFKPVTAGPTGIFLGVNTQMPPPS